MSYDKGKEENKIFKGGIDMLDLVLVVVSLLWFCNTAYFKAWSKVYIGGEQFSISITALIILAYVIVGLISVIKWRYLTKYHMIY